ncbi:hypothetical protein M378DRAFT_162624 [Amanita muscaria Koide BX008]|uniref:G domain-containing protein n=1 Tax=Amanita muscaria (strain Koide BX008) TaxID=946122 RepID=A0A0C2X8I2_AMAMK|nr:hypothetical protein M378DRAFT_162624 [Amanita muscaria Koide BX008]
MSRNNDSDSTLSSTFDAITSDCPQIRILVLGKTGCGKSSLINKAFGLEKDLAVFLHDSEGFEPGQDAKFNTVKRFIEERDRSEVPQKDRLHVIW